MTPELAASVAVPVVFLALWWTERRRPARRFVDVPGWARLGLGFFGLSAVVGSAAGALWKLAPLTEHALLNLSGWGLWGAVPGVLVVTFLEYWLHRAEHRVHVLWLASHQVHHSALRVDIAGAFVSHPVEVLIKVSVTVLVSSFVLGLSLGAALIVSTVATLMSLFVHWNVHTPRWLGFLLQRPEMHCLHHEFGVHGRNYGLPLWDLLFGTFENPLTAEVRVGFEPGASARMGDMLRMVDVNRAT